MRPKPPSRQIRSYQRYTVEVILGPVAGRLVDTAGPRRGERVLDLACGTGAVARLAAREVGTAGRVTGLDIDDDGLALARELPRDGAPIEWLQGDVHALPFPDRSFDLALCSQGLQFFTDRERFLTEVARVLVPGGRFVAGVWRAQEFNPYYQALQQALEPHVGAGTRARLEAPFALADPAALRDSFVAAGLPVAIEPLRLVVTMPPLESFIPGHLSGMAAAAELESLSRSALGEIVRTVASALRGYREAPGLRVPFEVLLARATGIGG